MKNVFWVLGLFLFGQAYLGYAQETIYVNASATGANTGISWEDAFTDLQDALAIADSLDRIWIAKGIYKPTNCTRCTFDDRIVSFQLKAGVAIYGGFQGNESVLSDRDSINTLSLQQFVTDTLNTGSFNKNLLVNRFSATVLSGDIGQTNNIGDNSFHVVAAEDINHTTSLDGLVIMEGNAYGYYIYNRSGGGMYLNNSSPIINRCTFISNQAFLYGGGVYTTTSNPTLNHCTFSRNSTRYGGGIYNFESNPSLKHCIFVDNQVNNEGGAIYNKKSRPVIDSCYFTRNRAIYGYGGGIYNSESPAVLNESTFTNNSTRAGGGIANFSSSLIISQCTFWGNQVDYYGGGIYNTLNSNPTLIHCEFIGNKSRYGGAIFNFESNANLSFCTFSSNQAIFQGGGICNNDSRPILDYCTFSENQAKEGGGIFNLRSPVTLNRCAFLGNSTSSGGGGILNFQSDVELDSCTFSDNKARWGGGIYNNQNSSPVLDSCYFNRNQANDGGGGGIYNLGNSSPTLNRCTFTENQAYHGGGILNSQNSNSTLSHCIFTKNTAEFLGGGIYNWIGKFELDSCIFSGNQANNGGGIYNSRSSLVLNRCAFTENQANLSGGGIYYYISSLVSTSRLAVNSCTFTKNEAKSGGGIYNDESNPTLHYCIFTENLADSSGGGIYNLLSSPEIEYSTFRMNQAPLGGGIYNVDGSSPVFEYCLFEENQALEEGGAIYNKETNPIFNHCTFTGNLAQSYGGGIYNWLSTSTLTNCTLSHNHAKENGGGMYGRKSKVHLTANTLAFNQAESNGGGIYSAEVDSVFLRNCLISDNHAGTGKELFQSSNAHFLSSGHNLIQDITYSNILPHSTDIFGDSLNPINALLDTSLAQYGTPTKTIALLRDSPALGRGEPKENTNILIDQKGFSRVVGSKSDSIDIGAYEHQHTFVFSDSSKQVCMGNPVPVSLGEIVLADSTGGAWPVDTVKRYILEFPKEVIFIPDSAKVTFEGSGFKDTSFQVIDNQVRINYEKTYSTEPHFIRLKGLKVQASHPGIYYMIRNSLGDAYQADNELRDSISHASVIVLPVYSEKTLPYEENFETGKGGWQEALEVRTPLWEWGMPRGVQINDAASGKFAWATDLDSKFSPDVQHSVYSPCFDLQSLERPIIELKVYSDTRKDLEGTVLQISTDQGNSWQTVGSNQTGKNWYNSNSVIANPGNQPIDAQFGWSGRDTSWYKVLHHLDAYKEKGLIRFRMTFRSTDFEEPIESYEGFAFDDVFVGNRTRMILLENFTSTSSNSSLIDSLVNLSRQDVIALHYHFHPQDELFRTNPTAPTSRALYYGKAQTKETVVGGIDFQGLSEKLTTRIIDTSALRSAKFEIFIDTASNTPISILPNENIDDEIIIQVAVIENDIIAASSGKMYHQVLRKFLPTPGGISFFRIKQADTLFIPIEAVKWEANTFPQPSIVDEYSNLEVVVFVQNQRTKEVYQAEKVKIWQNLLDPDLVEREGEINNKPKVSIFPNPAKREFFVIGDVGELQILDMQGRKALQQILPNKHSLSTVDISHLAQGVYQVILIRELTVLLREKIIKID